MALLVRIARQSELSEGGKIVKVRVNSKRAGRLGRAPAVCPALHPAVGSFHLPVGSGLDSQNSVQREPPTRLELLLLCKPAQATY